MNNEEKILQILTQMQGDISDLKQGQVNMNGRLDNLEQGQASMQSDISNLKQGQAKLEKGQARLEAKIEDIDLNIRGLWEDVKRADLRLDRHEREYHQYG